MGMKLGIGLGLVGYSGISGLFPAEYGATFYKQYDENQVSLDADFSVGSSAATFTAARSASSPATTIETQDGNALLFDGVGDIVTSGDLTKVTNELTEIYWIKKDSFSGTHRVNTSTTFPSGFSEASYYVHTTSSSGTDNNNPSGTYGFESGKLHMLSIVRDTHNTNDCKVYLDGVLKDTASYTNAANGTMTLGVYKIGAASTQSFDGQIKEVLLYDTVLSTEQLLSIYNGGIVDGAFLHYDFSNGSGSTLTDIVGGNDGNITGAKWLTSGAKYITKVTASNTPRFTQGYYNWTGYNSGAGLLIEGASSNLIVHGIFDADTAGLATGWSQSDDITNAATMTMVAENFTNISGSRAQRWQQTFGDGSFAQYESTSTAVGSAVQDELITFSVWLKGTVTGITKLFARIRERDASAVAGTLHDSGDLKASLSSTEWRRFTFTTTAVDADASRVTVAILFTQPGSGSIDLQIAGAQVEQAAYPSSLIPTTSAALTRNEEILKYVIANNRTAATESLAIVFRPSSSSGKKGTRTLLDTATKRRQLKLPEVTNDVSITPNESDSPSSLINDIINESYSAHQLISIGVSMQNTATPYIAGYFNGEADGTDESTDNFTTPSWGTYFYVGANNGTGTNYYGIIHSVAFFSKFLSAEDQAKVHTILGGS